MTDHADHLRESLPHNYRVRDAGDGRPWVFAETPTGFVAMWPYRHQTPEEIDNAIREEQGRWRVL